MTLGPVLIVCLVLIAVAVLLPSKKKSQVQPGVATDASAFRLMSSEPARFSIREQQAEEAAAAIAAEFRRKDQEAWLAEQIERASTYFGGPPAKA